VRCAIDPLSFRLTDALAKNGVVDLGTDDIAISEDQRKLITDGDDLEAKSVMAITSVDANARNTWSALTKLGELS
jgi:hypothetical protein